MRWVLSVTALVCLGPVSLGVASDWPMWRHDAARSGATAGALPDQLAVSWWRDLPANHVAWEEDPRIQFDATHEPIVVGQTLMVASSRTDSITALDTRTGKQRWVFFADGPIRFAPVARRGAIYFGSDDGHVYCVDIASGKLVWKFNAAPTGRLVVGNERLISVWPIRGGPVVGGDKLYFTAGVWPFEGTSLYALDLAAADGQLPPHTVTQLDNVSPQGYLVYNQQRLYIPGGRAKATCIDIRSGKIVSLNYNSSGKTDYHVASAGPMLFHGDKVFHTQLARMMPCEGHRPVSDGHTFFAGNATGVVAFNIDRRRTIKGKDRKGKDVEKDEVPQVWQVAVETGAAKTVPVEVYCQAGPRVFGCRGESVFAVQLGAGDAPPTVAWKAAIEGQPTSMVAADERLFVVTRGGRIYSFADVDGAPTAHPLEPTPATPAAAELKQQVSRLVGRAADPAGYCLVLGLTTGQLALELARQSDLRVIAVDQDPQVVRDLRLRALAEGIDPPALSARVADPRDIQLPPYLATLITSERPQSLGLTDARQVARLYASLRPYGGSWAAPMAAETGGRLEELVQAKTLPQAELSREAGWVALTRVGALPGAADWTHEYGDAANTLMSQDQLVRAPLGLLWFGGPASNGELYYNRHYWGPGLTVVDGRMVVQGPQRLASIDIYTGRVLWKREVRDGSGPGRRGNFFEKEKPGYHFVAVSDSVYLVYPDHCLRLDPQTGETLAELKLPSPDDRFGKVRVWRDQLIVTVFREHEKLGMMPLAITAIDRFKGELKWTRDASYSVPLVAVGKDTVYFFDGVLKDLYDAAKRRGLVPESEPFRYLKALDAKTGKPLWERTTSRVVTWLGYSQQHDILVVSNKRGIDALRGKDGEELWKKDEEAPGFGGHPENVWDKVIVSGDLVIDQRGPGRAFQIQSGKVAEQTHPITGEAVPWQFTKTGHHCNYAIASPHLLTFRADVAGFFDRETMGSARLPGFRSGCRNSLIPAGGVLNAPNYAHGCSCSYNLFTSLGLVHVPDVDLWTYNALKSPQSASRRFGINLGAPGDRLAADGTLWMEFPKSGDPSASLEVQVDGEKLKWFRQHSSKVQGGRLKWVAASGVEGASKLRVTLPGTELSQRRYQVNLFFLEPNAGQTGRRLFDVSIQGREVLKDLDVAREAGGSGRSLEKRFNGVLAKDQIEISFRASRGESVICAVEVIAESQ